MAPGILDARLSKQEMEAHREFRERFGKLIPVGKMQKPEDVVDVVGFPASPESNYLTGASILCDGGCWVGCPSIAGSFG